MIKKKKSIKVPPTWEAPKGRGLSRDAMKFRKDWPENQGMDLELCQACGGHGYRIALTDKNE